MTSLFEVMPPLPHLSIFTKKKLHFFSKNEQKKLPLCNIFAKRRKVGGLKFPQFSKRPKRFRRVGQVIHITYKRQLSLPNQLTIETNNVIVCLNKMKSRLNNVRNL